MAKSIYEILNDLTTSTSVPGFGEEIEHTIPAKLFPDDKTFEDADALLAWANEEGYTHALLQKGIQKGLIDARATFKACKKTDKWSPEYGQKNKDIAERLEMSDCNVSQIIRSPLGQAYLEGLQDKAKESTLDVRKKLISLNSSALTVLERIMNPAEKAPHSVQLTAAKDVLDRTGYKAPDSLHVDMTMQTKTDQEIEAEIMAMQESISKTYLQSPGKTVTQSELAESETILFTDEQQVEASHIDNENFELDDEGDVNEIYIDEEDISLDNVDMGSSDKLVTFSKDTYQDDSIDLSHVSPISSFQTSEESISLLAKLPASIFQQN